MEDNLVPRSRGSAARPVSVDSETSEAVPDECAYQTNGTYEPLQFPCAALRSDRVFKLARGRERARVFMGTTVERYLDDAEEKSMKSETSSPPCRLQISSTLVDSFTSGVVMKNSSLSLSECRVPVILPDVSALFVADGISPSG